MRRLRNGRHERIEWGHTAVSGMHGANADDLDRAAADLAAQAARLESIERLVTSRLHSSAWAGPGASRFRDTWNSVDRRAILAAGEALHGASGRLRGEAAAQTGASIGGGNSYASILATAAAMSGAELARALSGEDGQALGMALLDLLGQLADTETAKQLLSGGGSQVLQGFLSVIAGPLTMWLAYDDFYKEHPYQGNFSTAESAADLFSFGGGTLTTIGGVLVLAGAVATTFSGPVGLAIAAVGADACMMGMLVSTAGLAIDMNLKAWDDFGRDAFRSAQTLTTEAWQDAKGAWNEVSPWIGPTWDMAYDGGRQAVSRAAEEVADNVSEAADHIGEVADDAKDAISTGWQAFKGMW